MSDPRPLWVVMYHSFWKCPTENWRLSSAYMIRAVRDWLVPEGPSPSEHLFDGDSNPQWDRWKERQRLRALLTAEAARAERGESEPEGKVQRVYINNPVQIAEYGGPCMEGGPEACDCGALWRDQPEPEGPTDEELMAAFDGEFAEFFDSSDGFGTTAIPRSEWIKVARAVLARWGASSRSN